MVVIPAERHIALTKHCRETLMAMGRRVHAAGGDDRYYLKDRALAGRAYASDCGHP